MASNTGSRVGLSGLASSLRSAASTSSGNTGNGSQQHQQRTQQQQQQRRGADAMVPDEDDSTEEDEDYNSYIHEQEQQQRGGQLQGNSKGSGASHLRQMLRDEDDNSSSDMDVDSKDNHKILQARQNEILEDDDDEFDEDEEMDDDEESRSETPPLTEDDIDFNLVYAFHTFAASQEGQASVVRNDSLVLLEDTNVYWWLVRVLKTGVIGYIPAENIEVSLENEDTLTPFERLARLNKHRNVKLSASNGEWGTFDDPIQPLDPATLAARSMNRRSVIFTAQNEYFGASENEWDSDSEEEDGEIGEYYENEDESSKGEDSDRSDDNSRADQQQQQQQQQDTVKTSLQLEAERVEQEILEEQRQQRSRGSKQQQQQYKMEDSADDISEVEEEKIVTNRHRRPLLDDDELLLNDEPRKISLTPSIAQDEMAAARVHTPPGKAKKLRLDEAALNSNSGSGSLRSGGFAQQQQQRHKANENGDAEYDSEEEARQQTQRQLQERSEAKLAALLGEKGQQPAARQVKDDSESGTQESSKKPGKFKSLFGVGKSSKEKEKERKEKERQDKERQEKERQDREQMKSVDGVNNSASKASSSPGGGSINNVSNNDAYRARTNSNGSVASAATGNSVSAAASSAQPDNEDTPQDVIAIRVYPGNVDFGASMYKTVVVSPATMASEVANQAVVKFRLAPDGVAATTDFFLTVRGVDGGKYAVPNETVLLPTDKVMAIYQSLTAHLTTPLPPNHRLSISSISSMMSVNSTSSYTSNPSTPTSPNSARRISTGRSDPHRHSIRFLLNKRRRKVLSISSIPTTPTTPTTPNNPQQDDFFWVKVICQAEDLPQSMTILDGIGTALDKSDPRVQGQIAGSKIEHWVPMRSVSNAGDVIVEILEKLGIRHGTVDGVPENVLAEKRSLAPNGIVIEYQLSLRLNGQTSRRAKEGDEMRLPPQIPLTRCFEDHQLAPVRRSRKADVASMLLAPDHVFYLRKTPKSTQAEMEYARQHQQQQERQQSPKKVPAPLQAQSLRSGDAIITDSPKSPRSLRSLRNTEDTRGSESNGPPSPASPGMHQSRSGSRTGFNGANSPSSVSGGNVLIPRRTDSAAMGPMSPTFAASHDGHNPSGRPSPTMNQQGGMLTSRTPTPDHVGRNRSPSISQSPVNMRSGQAPSPSPSHHSSHAGADADGFGSRSSTPERPARPERPQRAISPSMTHGSSPLSLAAVVLQEGNNNKYPANAGPQQENDNASKDRPLSIAPLSIKKNATQGMDITLNKGVIRSSRLMNSKQYRYSFIPVEGGDEVDISEIIEDILGEDNDGYDDNSDSAQNQDPNEESMAANGARRGGGAGGNAGSSSVSASGRDSQPNKAGVSGQRPERSPSTGIRQATDSEQDRLELLTNSARGGDTLMKLERVLAGNERDETKRSRADQTRNTPSPAAAQNRAVTNTTPIQNKRDSDVEIQIASLASLANRSVSPKLSEPPSSVAASPAGASRSLRPASPFGVMAKGTLLSNTNSAAVVNGKPSSLKESNVGDTTGSALAVGQDSASTTTRSFSPIPRRLQSPGSPAPTSKQSPSERSSPNLRPASPSGRAAAMSGSMSPVNARSTSGTSTASTRNRSASTSVADTNNSSSRLAQLANSSKNSSTSSLNSAGSSSSNGNSKEWMLSSDYNAGMQDLLTLVRAGRSSSVSSGVSSTTRLAPLFGKDGKMLALSSTVKASLLSGNGSGGMSPSLSAHLDTQEQEKQRQGGEYDNSDINNKRAKEEQTRMMLIMLNELTLKDVQEDCHPEVYECWKDVDADLDRVERELDELLVTVKASAI
ncbi:hypothetical protein BGZ99_008171 [Dissophora globulifera]|uniref:SH3 domain-containing protein n=1 Tax=Dissophora globulifera TaxID=979702 RepID=A0A9P6RVY1_9FUNG|nr:hypothetical protein BGZ99_008171 [Dissophora globulifera]